MPSGIFGVVASNYLEESTKQVYKYKENNFIQWLKDNHYGPICFENDTFHLECVTADMLYDYISDITVHGKGEKIGKLKSQSVSECHHSALVNMYKSKKIDIPPEFEALWKKFNTGYKKKIAKMVQTGEISTEGSDRLTFGGYKYLSSIALKSITNFTHLYLLLAWNMMLRCSNLNDLKYGLIAWGGDHIQITIPRHKGDQTGENGLTTKCIYANPLNPNICVFLSLGVIILSKSNYVQNEYVFTNINT